MNRNRIRVSIDQTPLPVRIPLNDLPCLDHMEHVSHADPIFESLSERVVRDKEVALPDGSPNSLHLHSGAA